MPGRVFANALASAGCSHGALLIVSDSDGLYSPIAFAGFDETTARRLRIPRDIAEQHAGLVSGHAIVLTGQKRQFLEPFFSVRAYGALVELALVPLLHDDVLFGIMIFARDEDETPLEGRTLAFSETAAGEVFESYYSKINPLPDLLDYSGEDAIRARVEALLHNLSDSNSSLVICTVDLYSLLDAVRPSSPHFYSYRFEADVLRVLQSMASSSGIFHKKDSSTVALGFPTRAIHDRNFLQHHLKQSLSEFFAGSDISDDIFSSSVLINKKELSFDTLSSYL